MRGMSTWLLAIAVCGIPLVRTAAQDCPQRPATGTVVADPLSLSSQNGALTAQFTLGHLSLIHI